jgi:hypothetical protein
MCIGALVEWTSNPTVTTLLVRLSGHDCAVDGTLEGFIGGQGEPRAGRREPHIEGSWNSRAPGFQFLRTLDAKRTSILIDKVDSQSYTGQNHDRRIQLQLPPDRSPSSVSATETRWVYSD